MIRRDFLKLVATALGGSPVLANLIQSQRAIDYGLFCDPWALRFAIDKPFGLDYHCFATDARILIRTDDPGIQQADAQLPVPPVHSLPWDQFDSRGWVSSSKLARERDTQQNGLYCDQCYGRGRKVQHSSEWVRCDRCIEGYEWDDAIKTPITCTACCGTEWMGGVRCDACGGTGWSEELGVVYRLGQSVYAPDYVARLKTLGELDLLPLESGLLLFRGQGIQGMMMNLMR